MREFSNDTSCQKQPIDENQLRAEKLWIYELHFIIEQFWATGIIWFLSIKVAFAQVQLFTEHPAGMNRLLQYFNFLLKKVVS